MGCQSLHLTLFGELSAKDADAEYFSQFMTYAGLVNSCCVLDTLAK
jgi:hypothetical protein